jgi:hypothetical protein
MAKDKIFRICGTCKGTKKIMTTVSGEPGQPTTKVEIDCPACGGDGYVEWGYVKEILWLTILIIVIT